MAIKKCWQIGFISLLLSLSLISIAKAYEASGNFIEMMSYFKSIEDKPFWVLILRDEDTGQILPYILNIRDYQSHWVAFSYSHTYRVLSSELHFLHHRHIENFCHLESGQIRDRSMVVTLTGRLTPNANEYYCQVQQFPSYPFPIVNH